MPAIKVRGRKLPIATDDLFFPGVLSVFVRLIWMTLTCIVIYFFTEKDGTCQNNGDILTTYLYGALVLIGFVGLVDGLIAYVSSRGTVMSTHERRSIPTLFVLRVVLSVPEVGWLFLGTVWAWNSGLHGDCPTRDLTLVRVAVVSAWVVYVLVGLMVLCFGAWFGKDSVDEPDKVNSYDSYSLSSSSDPSVEIEEARWQRICSIICCTSCRPAEKNNPDFSSTIMSVSQLFARFFKGIRKRDIVASDFCAGMILLSQIQKEQIKNGEFGRRSPSGAGDADSETAYGPCSAWRSFGADGAPDYPSARIGSVSLGNHASLEAYEHVVHFMKFAMGPYGWPLFIFERLVTGTCRLVPHCRCCICLQSTDTVVEGDCPMSHCNTAAALSWTGLSYDDIVFATYDDSTFMRLPFFVAIDDSHRSIVVAVRGTMSLKDALTDMDACPRTVPTEGRSDFQAHSGILQSAEYIKAEIDSHDWIGLAFERARQRAPNHTYDLVFVGHSLGAGACSLLALMYRSRYPNLRCFAYSPPGGLVNAVCARYTTEFAVSVVLGDDVIPRLSLPAMYEMRDDVIQCLYNTSYSKPRIMTFGCCAACCPPWCCCNHLDVDPSLASSSPGISAPSQAELTNPERPLLAHQALHGAGPSHQAIRSVDVPSTTVTIDMTDAGGSVIRDESGKRSSRCSFDLFPPGRVLHLTEAQSASCCTDARWSLGWIPFDSLRTIRVSNKMAEHHLPDRVKKALEDVYKEF